MPAPTPISLKGDAEALNIEDLIFAAWDMRLHLGAEKLGFRTAPAVPSS